MSRWFCQVKVPCHRGLEICSQTLSNTLTVRVFARFALSTTAGYNRSRVGFAVVGCVFKAYVEVENARLHLLLVFRRVLMQVQEVNIDLSTVVDEDKGASRWLKESSKVLVGGAQWDLLHGFSFLL